MMRVIIAILFTSLFAQLAHSQELIGSAGRTDSIANAEVSWSVGETVVTTGSVANFDLTQGYIQPSFTLVSIKEESSLNDFQVDLFPNPAIQEFTINLSRNVSRELLMTITDVLGKKIQEQRIEYPSQTFNVSELKPATYYVTIYSQDNQYSKQLKLIKTQ